MTQWPPVRTVCPAASHATGKVDVGAQRARGRTEPGFGAGRGRRAGACVAGESGGLCCVTAPPPRYVSAREARNLGAYGQESHRVHVAELTTCREQLAEFFFSVGYRICD